MRRDRFFATQLSDKLDRESDLSRCIRLPLIARDENISPRPMPRGFQGCDQLQCISGAERILLKE